jgi:hypothetical protein
VAISFRSRDRKFLGGVGTCVGRRVSAMYPNASMWASKRRLTTVEVSSSTMTAGPGKKAPGSRLWRSWIATPMNSPVSGSKTGRWRAGWGVWGSGAAAVSLEDGALRSSTQPRISTSTPGMMRL